MDVRVDGASNFRLEGIPEDVLSALAAVVEYLQGEGRALQSVMVDGEAIVPEAITEKLKGRAIADTGVLEVKSERIAVLVEQCLTELDGALPELPAACRSLAEVFHSEHPEDGYAPFEELANIWRHVKSRQHLVTRALGLDIAAVPVGGSTLEALHAELNQHLRDALQALRDGDCVTLGDLLEYELAPRAEQETQIVAVLREHAAAASMG